MVADAVIVLDDLSRLKEAEVAFWSAMTKETAAMAVLLFARQSPTGRDAMLRLYERWERLPQGTGPRPKETAGADN